MKRSLLVFIALIGFASLKAQTVNDVPVSEIDVKYIEIVSYQKFMSNKVRIEVNFGQRNKFFSANDALVKDETGQVIKFDTYVDAINFFADNGYEFLQAFAEVVGSQSILHFMLKKEEA